MAGDEKSFAYDCSIDDSSKFLVLFLNENGYIAWNVANTMIFAVRLIDMIEDEKFLLLTWIKPQLLKSSQDTVSIR